MEATTIDIETLRRLYASQPEATSTRILALVLCGAFLFAVLTLVRKGKLREEYTPIWTVVALGTMVMSIWFDIVHQLTRLVGAWTPSSTLFFFGLLFLLVVSLNYAVRLSGMSLQLKLLAQEVALLRAELGGRADTTANPTLQRPPATSDGA